MTNRFFVEYELYLEPGLDVDQVAKNICLEQTVELSDDLIVEDSIRERVVGQIESIVAKGRNVYQLRIGYHWSVAGHEIPQLMNVLFGNISLKNGIKLANFDGKSSALMGPQYGLEGIRELVGRRRGPLVCTALKPMGSSPKVLASMAYNLALGGMDIIKDDHGLANQSFAPFEERVALVQESVNKANQETGGKTVYFPNFAPTLGHVEQQLRFIKDLEIKGILISPFLVGLDALRFIRQSTQLFVMTHPALSGGYFSHPHHGVDAGFLLGKWFRMLGSDANIYPNVGGRFLFDLATCQSINRGCLDPIPGIKPAFPVPAGGMALAQIPQMRRMYGEDLIILIGSGLFREDANLGQAALKFRQAVEVHLSQEMET